jgi:hypothetical protein
VAVLLKLSPADIQQISLEEIHALKASRFAFQKACTQIGAPKEWDAEIRHVMDTKIPFLFWYLISNS